MGRARGGTLIFDPTLSTSTYGLHECPRCQARFHGGGPALHRDDCPVREEGYDACNYHFGAKEFLVAVDDTRSPIPWRQEQGEELVGRVQRELPQIFAMLDGERRAAVVIWNETMRRYTDEVQVAKAVRIFIGACGNTAIALELQRRLDRRLFEVDTTP